MENVMKDTNDFQDWEVLPSNSNDNSLSLNPDDEIHSEGLLQPNYFSLDALNRSCLEDTKSVGSDNPSWVEPGSDDPIRYLNKESGDFWSDSGSDLSDAPKTSDSLEKNEANLSESLKIGEIVDAMVENSENLASDSFRIEEGSGKLDSRENSDLGVESDTSWGNGVEGLGGEKLENEAVRSADENGNNKGDEVEKRGVVWWKMPMEFLKRCLFRMNPVWAVTVAAAVMGFVVLGRRLYKMKRKVKGLEIKVAFDDKKASQVLSRAARLNEAFSIVKRVPVIRPSLPAVGGTTWPAMSLRYS